jgi:two-component system sensor histidine kinase PilS (NtrC family)
MNAEEPVSTESRTTADRAQVRRTLPSQRTMISWLFAARTLLAVVTLFGAALFWTDAPDISFIVSVAVLIAFTITAYGWWSVWVRETEPGLWFLHAQAVVDLGLTAILVHFSGGVTSPFTSLYVVFISAYAVLMPTWAGAIVTTVASGAYAAEAVWFNPGGIDVGVGGQVGVFAAVFVIVATLGHRLRQASVEQHTLRSELVRIRLEADDILRNIRSGVLTIDSLGRLAFINPTAERLLQIDGASAMGLPVLDQLKGRSSELWAAIVAGIRHGRKVNRGEGFILREDGSMFPIGVTTTTFEHGSAKTPSVTALFTDISDSKQLHELHLRAERLEAVAALSASLAHEIRNPLASIRSSVEQLAQSAHSGEDEKVLGNLIMQETDRLNRLLSEFLDFSRVRATNLVPVDLLAIVQAAARLVQQHPDCCDNVTMNIEGPATVIDGDEDLLHRVVANLLLNAAQAAQGPVTVSVALGGADVSDLPQGSGVENPVRLQIRDTGPGIPTEIIDDLFQPFVTGRAGGTGLGLAIVQRAVDAHRGLVMVDSSTEGTTFTIFFPSKWQAEEAV